MLSSNSLSLSKSNGSSSRIKKKLYLSLFLLSHSFISLHLFQMRGVFQMTYFFKLKLYFSKRKSYNFNNQSSYTLQDDDNTIFASVSFMRAIKTPIASSEVKYMFQNQSFVHFGGQFSLLR